MTLGKLTDDQILSLCERVNLARLRIEPVGSATREVISRIATALQKGKGSFHIYRWPDSTVTCFTCDRPFKQVSKSELVKGYCSKSLFFPVVRGAPIKSSTSLPCGDLFQSEPHSDYEIQSPALLFPLDELEHALKQDGLSRPLTETEQIILQRLQDRARRGRYFLAFAYWRGGVWSCLHRKAGKQDLPIHPGIFVSAFHGANAGERYFHLETKTTRDLTLHE